jgi:DNA-binding FadR family transcriptional regulator
MSLAQMLASLSADKLKEIQDAITTAGITREFKGDHRAIFKRLRSQSTGKAKKIYSALAKSSKEEMSRMSDALLSVSA